MEREILKKRWQIQRVSAPATGLEPSKRRGRPPLVPLSDEQLRDMWKRWRDGASMSDIGRTLGNPPATVYALLATRGGFSPTPRRRRAGALSLTEREEIAMALSRGLSMRLIANSLGRAPSTVCREVQRNGGPHAYRPTRADERAWSVARRPKPCKLLVNRRLASV